MALAMFATEREARAYTDPGSGALIWQMLVAGLVGVSFYFRRITAWFKNRKGPKV
jgi:NADH:ubiquinone oxidoreductase subunit H